MGWRTIEKQKSVRPSRQLINEFADMEPVPGDRPFKPWLASILRTAIAQGEFRGNEWASVRCIETGKTYRVNGKHTSKVMQAMNGELLPTFDIIVSRFECDTLSEAASLYATFDPRFSLRTTSDLNRSVAATIPELADVGSGIVNLCVTAIEFSVNATNATNKLPHERAEALRENVDFVLWIQGIVGSKSNKDAIHINRGPVVAAMYLTFKKHPELCTDFWMVVKKGGAPVDSPQQKLERYLIRSVIRGSDNKVGCSPREMFVKCIHAWNAWKHKRPTSLQYFVNSPIPAPE